MEVGPPGRHGKGVRLRIGGNPGAGLPDETALCPICFQFGVFGVFRGSNRQIKSEPCRPERQLAREAAEGCEEERVWWGHILSTVPWGNPQHGFRRSFATVDSFAGLS